ncbi:hypothetical protein Lalb_Chr02g0141151 [Lupinus albus]|uniref:Uncharacterized protein n=1 Tax=Lupinus albus TaxID=3870 RepID=A0A6A4QWR6_LUPAL|nr:hypothetical protein Lalb_Chr02g0141151 [Lupinus albus]
MRGCKKFYLWAKTLCSFFFLASSYLLFCNSTCYLCLLSEAFQGICDDVADDFNWLLIVIRFSTF